MEAGDNVLGLQNGTECWSGKNIPYDTQGKAENCPTGGRGWTNQVYTLDGYQFPPPQSGTLVTGKLVNLQPNPTITRGNLIGSISGSTKNYKIAFDLTIRGILNEWQSILRFTQTDDNCCNNNPNRIPGFWLEPGSSKLFVVIGDTSNGEFGFGRNRTPNLPSNTPIRIELSAVDQNVTLVIQNIGSWSIQQPRGRIHTEKPIQVYAGDKFHAAAKASISNLSYQIL
jgi:hypothetical protein